MKKALSIILAVMLIITSVSVFAVSADTGALGAPAAFDNYPALYAHAVLGSADSDAWQAWQSIHDESFYVSNDTVKYFFLPSSADSSRVDIYNGFSSDVTVNGVKIASRDTATVPYKTGVGYQVSADGRTYTLRYMNSNAEAAIYINNSDADGNGTELMSYLNVDKSRKAKATGAIVEPDGSIDNTAIKKIKGRGNTTWQKPKKAYNITYDKKVSVAGMTKSKKYSILANYQDDSLSRNRFLYDLSDAVEMPYASDSRYVDFYVNGFYWGSYQMTEKIEAGDLVYDVDEEDYLNADGTVKDDFSFIAEVDAGANDNDDYYVQLNSGVKITIKSPEIDPGAVGYNEVKAYVKEKFEAFAAEAKKPAGKVSDYADLESVTKLYLINELGKNWDSGVSSTFFTYKLDENGSYKFFGSPVWDYDNSLGNAVGVGGDLNNMGVSDYTSYTGWWCKYKGKSSRSKSSDNIINNLALNKEVLAAAPQIWFEKFVPAINHFEGTASNAELDKELYTAQHYYKLVNDSAEMNYTSGWLLNTGSWIANHSSLTKASFDVTTNTYATASRATSYSNNFTGMFNYTVDWMTSRAAWLSSQMYKDYTPTPTDPTESTEPTTEPTTEPESTEPTTEPLPELKLGDVDRNGIVTINDATEIQRKLAGIVTFDAAQTKAADTDGNGIININDATRIQRYIAGLEGLGDEPEPNENKILFTNSLRWSGTIYAYYWGDGYNPYVWPGEPAKQVEVNQYNEDVYEIEVPEEAQYIIFSNNTNVQTVNIPLDGKTKFYIEDDAVPVEKNGSYRYPVAYY